MGIFGSKSGPGLPVEGFDFGKRYDIYLQFEDKLVYLRDVKCKCLRTWDHSSTEDESLPFETYVEVVDPNGKSLFVSLQSVVLFAEAGTAVNFSQLLL